jgi:hypothetical protein
MGHRDETTRMSRLDWLQTWFHRLDHTLFGVIAMTSFVGGGCDVQIAARHCSMLVGLGRSTSAQSPTPCVRQPVRADRGDECPAADAPGP